MRRQEIIILLRKLIIVSLHDCLKAAATGIDSSVNFLCCSCFCSSHQHHGFRHNAAMESNDSSSSGQQVQKKQTGSDCSLLNNLKCNGEIIPLDIFELTFFTDENCSRVCEKLEKFGSFSSFQVKFTRVHSVVLMIAFDYSSYECV